MSKLSRESRKGYWVTGLALAIAATAGCWDSRGAATGAEAGAGPEGKPLVVSRASVEAQEPQADGNPHVWSPKIQSVAVFKNGLGFFVREGKVTLQEGWCVAREIPPATFGTLAIYARDETQMVDIVGSGPGEVVEFDGQDAPDDPAARRARLEASKDLKVQLFYRHKGEDREAAGKLVSVGPEFVVLEDERNSFAVPLDGIRKMQLLELPLRVHVAAEKEVPQATLGMAYLRKGITWVPDYTLKIVDDETAELVLRGTLVNEAEDLIHSDVHLVVGVPHFVHTEYMAPIAVGQVIRTIGAAMAANVMPQQVTSQIMNRAAIVANVAAPQLDRPSVVERPVEADGDLGKALGNLPQLDSSAASDYTVYTKKDLTLRRGEKAILTLLTQKIQYSHTYHWPIPRPIEHSLLLHNTTGTAWTTGPCLAMSGDSPLSEDLLRYVPKGGHGSLPVTSAINVAHEKSEREVERKLKAHSPSHEVYFDLVTLEGTLKIRNFEKRPVDVTVTNGIPGKPIAADFDGSISIDPEKLRLLERQGSIYWRLKLAPGEEKTITYRYERYVPSN